MKYERKSIKDYPNYEIDTNGDVWSLRPFGHPNKTIMKMKKFIAGDYFRVHLHNKDGRRTFAISNLMLMTFVSPRPEGHQACHGPKGKLCDSLDNLYWASPSQNQLDRWRDGTMRYGENNPKAKLTELQVRIIKRLGVMRKSVTNITSRAIGEIFGVNNKSISDIWRGKYWSHIN